MKYATCIVQLTGRNFAPADPFATLLAEVEQRDLIREETQHHRTRLEALQRVHAYNSYPIFREGRPVFWMIALELEWDKIPAVEYLWIEGEQGYLESCMGFSCRMMSPTIEEAELLRHPLGGAITHPPGVACHLAEARRWIRSEDRASRRHLRESVACYRRRLWRPAAMMAGCVTEQLAVDLMAHYERVIDPDELPRYRKRLSRCGTAATQFRLFCKHFQPGKHGVTAEDHRALVESYQVIRRTRNQGCHIDDRGLGPVTREHVLTCYERLAEFCRQAHGITDRIKSQAAARQWN